MNSDIICSAPGENSKRILLIDIWRIVFSVLILGSHITDIYNPKHYCQGSYLLVEYFFLLSGFLLALQLDKMPAEKDLAGQTIRVWKRHILPLYPGYLIAFFAVFCYWNLGQNHVSLNAFLSNLLSCLGEICMLSATGFGVNLENGAMLYNSPAWYVSVLAVTLPIVIFACLRWKETFSFLMAPMIASLLYGYFYLNTHALWVWQIQAPFSLPLLRGFAGLCMGVFLGNIYLHMATQNSSREKTAALLFICIVAYTLILYEGIRPNGGGTTRDFSILLLIAVAIPATYALGKKLKWIAPRWMGQLAYYIYINHYFVLLETKSRVGCLGFSKTLCLTLTGTVMFSIAEVALLKAAKRAWLSFRKGE